MTRSPRGMRWASAADAKPIRGRSSKTSTATDPLTEARRPRPSVGCNVAAAICSSVVLPAPFGPRTAQRSSSSTVQSIASSSSFAPRRTDTWSQLQDGIGIDLESPSILTSTAGTDVPSNRTDAIAPEATAVAAGLRSGAVGSVGRALDQGDGRRVRCARCVGPGDRDLLARACGWPSPSADRSAEVTVVPPTAVIDVTGDETGRRGRRDRPTTPATTAPRAVAAAVLDRDAEERRVAEVDRAAAPCRPRSAATIDSAVVDRDRVGLAGRAGRAAAAGRRRRCPCRRPRRRRCTAGRRSHRPGSARRSRSGR